MIDHTGNANESVEEAREVVRRARGLLGTPWHDGRSARTIGPDDILV